MHVLFCDLLLEHILNYAIIIPTIFRILSEIEDNIMTNNVNSTSEFITKDNLSEEYITINTNLTDDNELNESKVQSINVTSTVRNVTINEDIPSFREWTKKHLEEAEKQPGL